MNVNMNEGVSSSSNSNSNNNTNTSICKPTDIRIVEAEPIFVEARARSPLKFGAVIMDDVTYCVVRVRVENRRGESSVGYGGIFLAGLWCFPDPTVAYAKKDALMRSMVNRICSLFIKNNTYGHPVELFDIVEQELEHENAAACLEHAVNPAMPFLGVLVCASPVDAAVHDAYGRLYGMSSYDVLGSDFVNMDLSHYLGRDYRGLYIDNFLSRHYKPRLPVFHLVGGLDKLFRDADSPADFPDNLEDWIARDGLYCLKIKLSGADIEWDLARTLDVDKAARNKVDKLYYSLDTNEQCRHPDYVIELLSKLRETAPDLYRDILYIEQPTERDLSAKRFDMRAVAAMKPIILDESLTSIADLRLAMALGWTGIAIKTCKCQSMELLMICAAEKYGIPYTLQDLTNPSLALIHSASLAARTNTMMGFESNSMQYYPHVSIRESAAHPDIFYIRDGEIRTDSLNPVGLGYSEKLAEEIYSSR